MNVLTTELCYQGRCLDCESCENNSRKRPTITVMHNSSEIWWMQLYEKVEILPLVGIKGRIFLNCQQNIKSTWVFVSLKNLQ